MSWIGSGENRQSIIGVLPDIATAFDALYQSLWRQPHLPAATLELCRLRLAQLHGSAAELQRSDCEIPAEQRANLQRWDKHESFSDADRACLAFTEVYAMDAQAVTDELADAVKAHFGDAGLVLLVEALGVLDGMIRLSLLWELPATPVAQDTRGAR